MKLFSFALVISGLMTSFISYARPIRVGISFATLAEERWGREKNLFEKEAKKQGIQVLFQSAGGDEFRQNQQIENLLTQGVDVLIIVAQNSKTAATAVKRAKEEGIPTIAYDRNISSPYLNLYLSFDSVRVGEIQARTLVKRKPKGRYFWLGGDPNDENAHLLKKGHWKVLQPLIKKGQITLVGEQWCLGWSPLEALKHTENMLTAQKNKVDAILASNDGTAGGAIQALAAQKLAGKVLVSGQDAELTAIERILQGSQTVTILKDVRKLVHAALIAAKQLAQKKPVTQAHDRVNHGKTLAWLLDVVPVTKQNVEKTIFQTGFHKRSELHQKQHALVKNTHP